MTSVPAVTSHVPPYKAWAFLLNNERAVQTGRQMFYIDASGRASSSSHGDLASDLVSRQLSRVGVVCHLALGEASLFVLVDLM